jgi:hypothetical protein
MGREEDGNGGALYAANSARFGMLLSQHRHSQRVVVKR